MGKLTAPKKWDKREDFVAYAVESGFDEAQINRDIDDVLFDFESKCPGKIRHSESRERRYSIVKDGYDEFIGAVRGIEGPKIYRWKWETERNTQEENGLFRGLTKYVGL